MANNENTSKTENTNSQVPSSATQAKLIGQVDAIINTYDQLDVKFEEFDLFREIREILPKDYNLFPTEVDAEQVAFGFDEKSLHTKELKLGTYFGPSIRVMDVIWPLPIPELISPDMINYWQTRAEIVKNPIMKARYLGLLWDLQKKITGNKPSYLIPQKYVEALLDVVSGNYQDSFLIFIKLKRALEVSSSVNNQVLLKKTKASILKYTQLNHSEENIILEWTFDLLLENKKFASRLSDSEKEGLIDKMEAKLTKLVYGSSGSSQIQTNPKILSIKEVATRLARYYKGKGQNLAEAQRVILLFGEAFLIYMVDDTPLQQYAHLDEMHKYYVDYGLREKEKEILALMRNKGPELKKSLQTVSFEINLPMDDVEAYFDSMITGNLKDDFVNFIISFIPDKAALTSSLHEKAQYNPTSFFMRQIPIGSKGRVVGELGEFEEDFDQHLIRHTKEFLKLGQFFIRQNIEKLLEAPGFDLHYVMNYLKKCEYIESSRYPIFQRGIEAYMAGDLVVFLHLIIPQIEELIRNLVETFDGNVMQKAKGKGYMLRSFGLLLDDEISQKHLGDNETFYLKVLFTEQIGLNLRNDICHGMLNSKHFNQSCADLVFHALFCVARNCSE
ncbi:DUF4209 domain-containing protein [uncultured Microscilla sp.]|uniref:DUF4209 domain-containing protein n=1 Tax=uncultured Microscilla sp. TaxID=432653 RepID=UPI0026068669|nr:DUF4209 domain-containing protein [uncultured Microscilla sp.]